MSNLNISILEELLEKRQQLQTLIGQTVHASINVHGVFIPPQGVQRRLHEFTQNLVCFTHLEEYQIQLIGTATGLSYANRKIFVATKHQMKEVVLSDVGILRLSKMSYLSSAGVLAYKAADGSNESDANDLCAFDYTPAANDDSELQRHFFRLDRNSILNASDDIVAYLAYGCPFDHQVYNIVDDNHVGLVIRSMTCEPIKASADEMLGSCRVLSTMDFDPNGLSGGPVFATVLSGNEFVLKFAGIINRAGGGLVHFIRAQSVIKLLNAGFDH